MEQIVLSLLAKILPVADTLVQYYELPLSKTTNCFGVWVKLRH